MNRILIIIIAVVSAYLIYGSLSEDEKVDTEAVAKIETQVILKDTPEIDEDLIDPDSGIETLDGVYSAKIITNAAETIQEYTFNSNSTFEVDRRIVVPANDRRSFIAKGTYEIVKNEVILTLNEDRNVKFFPKSKMTVKILKDDNLKYDTLILEKQ
jgi:hypothetical protein